MKKRTTIIGLCLVPLIALAVLTETRVTNFYGTYLEPIGNGRAKEFMGQKNFIAGVEVDIEKTAPQTLKISYGNEVQEFTNLPKDLFEMKEASWENFNIDFSRQSLSLSVDKFDGKSSSSSTMLKALQVNCLVTNRNRRNEYDVLITNCTKQGSVRLENLKNINNKKDNIVSIFFYKALQSQLASDVEVSNLKLDVNDHNFSFVSKVKASMSAKIKMSGKVWFLSGERVLKIRLDKAKASIISIKDKIFKELEASNDPNIRVERPNIYITLEK